MNGALHLKAGRRMFIRSLCELAEVWKWKVHCFCVYDGIIPKQQNKLKCSYERMVDYGSGVS